MGQQQPIRRVTSADGQEIPDKLYFRIGEVASLCGVPAYVLRFWESEFAQLKPNKGGTGQRLYRRRDVEMALRIKTLLYDEGYTIAGARQVFKSELRNKDKEPQLALGMDETPARVELQKLRRMRREIQDLLMLLSSPAGQRQADSRQTRQVVQSIRGDRSRPPVVELQPETLFDHST